MIPVPRVIPFCSSGDKTIECDSTLVCSKTSAWHAAFKFRIETTPQTAPDRLGVVIRLPAEEAWYLTADRHLAAVHAGASPPWPVGCFAIVRLNGSTFQVTFGPHIHFELAMRPNELVARFTLRDKHRCGLWLWGEEKLYDLPAQHTLNIGISRLQSPDQAVWIEPFPRAARSVICLTDHPDWDSCEKLLAVGDLFAQHDFRITKGVFPAADAEGLQYGYGPGLDSPTYAAVIGRWHEEGHEIAYHGIGSCSDISHLDLAACMTRIKALAPYHPETWIDHGCGRYGFVRFARLPGSVGLVDVLKHEGIRNLWSYTDAWENPAYDLNIWRRRSVVSSAGDFLALAARRGRMGLRQFAYLGTIPLKNIGGPYQYRRIFRRPWSVRHWRIFWRNYRQLRELNAGPLYFYSLAGDFALSASDDIWVFDTMVFNHLALQLTPGNIDRLAASNGILIGHIYLGWMASYGGRNCFKEGRPAEILPEFRENIAYISQMQRTARVATLPFRDLRQVLARYAKSCAIRRENGWDVDCDAVVCSRVPYRIRGQEMRADSDGLYSAEIHGSACLDDNIP